MGLRDFSIRISYTSKGKVNILDNFLIPALKCSKVYKRSVGFFSSSVFELTEVGVEKFIDNNGTIRIICSPELSQKDKKAIALGYQMKQTVEQESVMAELEEALEDVADDN